MKIYTNVHYFLSFYFFTFAHEIKIYRYLRIMWHYMYLSHSFGTCRMWNKVSFKLSTAYLSWFGFFVLMAYQLFLGYLMPKPFSYLNNSWEDKEVHTFPQGICPKVNVIARLEYELAYYDSAVHRFNHYTTRTPPVYLNSKLFIS